MLKIVKQMKKNSKALLFFFWVGPFFGKSDGEATNQQLFMMKI
jgi:hypothetical protein